MLTWGKVTLIVDFDHMKITFNLLKYEQLVTHTGKFVSEIHALDVPSNSESNENEKPPEL